MEKIKNAILKFGNKGSLVNATKELFSALNIPYQVISSSDYTPSEFFDKTDKFNDKITAINTVALIDEKALNNQFEELDSKSLRESDRYEALGVFTVELLEANPTRTTLVEITRAINREMEAFPVAVIFRYGNQIAIASTERTDYKSSNRSGEKVGKVSIIRDIDALNTHPGHLQILNELSIDSTGKKVINTFDELYKYWYSVFNVSLLNKKFYQELSNWYFWALREVKFPNEPNQLDLGLDNEKFDEVLKEHNGKNVIRLLTRILFVWFIKEKGLIPEEIFDEKIIADRFIDGFTPEKPESSFTTGKQTSKYYRAIIQNLFFATLNQPQGKREFRNKENRQHHNVTQLMRYKEYFKDPDYFIQLMEEKVPFMNGGLFECLDKPHPIKKGPQGGDFIVYIDGFSDKTDNVIEVPDYLFFDKKEELDLSSDYGDKKKKKEITRGLITILKNYKFTITENTPIEEEVALDPELLGKVFENLLASYNPETKSSARKQTGSFYTPREIVNYMVEESLIAYLKNKLDDDSVEDKLRELVSFSSVNPFENDVKTKNDIIKALDECTILDPACGSGAYPMGILQKMVHMLHKIDPKNEEWKQRQIDKVNKALEDIDEITDNVIREKVSKELKEQIKDIEESFENNELDYGRKLYLIENCIYGVDIQPIATQISKLRFFISLVVDQKVDASKENFGIRPLPNLETKFVAANTLIGLDKSSNLFDLPEIKEIEKQLKKVRHELFAAKTKKTKNEKRQLDKELREQIATKLEENGFGTDIAKKLASWDPFDQNTSSDFFDKEWMFDKSDGFDIVIGNPPYIQLSKDGGKLADLYQNKKFETFERTGDIYALFYENGIKLLKEYGNLNFITSNKWMCASYGECLRKFFIQYNPLKLIDLGAGVFENATVDTNILIITKDKNQRKCLALSLIKEKNIINFEQYQSNWRVIENLKEDSWIILSPQQVNLKNKIEKTAKPLKEWDLKINYGIKTGFNKAFIIDTTIKELICKRDSKSIDIIKPYYRGKDIKKYDVNWDDLWIITSHNGYLDSNNRKVERIKIENYIAIKNHLDQYLQQLIERQDQGETPYNLRNCAYMSEFYKEKIIYSEISNQPCFYLDSDNSVVGNTAYFLTGNNLKYLNALLNSKCVTYIFSNFYSINLGEKGYRYLAQYMENLPIPETSSNIEYLFINLVNQIYECKKNNQNTSILEHQIDVMVYHLYELTYEEACIIDPELTLEDFEKYTLTEC